MSEDCPDDCDSYGIDAKLNYLRQNAADALLLYINLLFGAQARGSEANVAAKGYISAQARYTMACLEAKRDDILPYIDLSDDSS